MIGLVLLACHLVGDFVFQTRWQAQTKLTDQQARARHVTAYCVPFAPFAIYWGGVKGLGFLIALWLLHFLTDSQRLHSTLGDVAAYWAMSEERRAEVWELHGTEQVEHPWDLDLPPANPWPLASLMIDQSLHVAQVAILGLLLLT